MESDLFRSSSCKSFQTACTESTFSFRVTNQANASVKLHIFLIKLCRCVKDRRNKEIKQQKIFNRDAFVMRVDKRKLMISCRLAKTRDMDLNFKCVFTRGPIVFVN